MHVVVGPLTDFPDGRGVPVVAGGRALAVFRVGERVFAIDDRCPHRGFPLNDGICDGTTVRCRTHGATFALADGALVCGPARRGVATVGAAIVDGQVVVEVGE
jgi:nitrite reductase/ring-hydroxylating ferredoxin subunit